ncbi:MAG: TetR/AcrR family transcriptional regulator [Gammaproteobacteria bacterium]|nr:MAG: TetR/AcrR family transcriptional regulator [Gammaproteobacteria bacterium]
MPYLTRDEPVDESIGCRILTAALQLFVERGYHNVSIHDVQKRAGVSIGSIYNHYGGKEGVAKGLYRHLLTELEAVIDNVIAGTPSPQAQCERVIRQLLDFTESRRDIMAFIFATRHREFLPGEPPICNSAPFMRLRDIVRHGIEQGTFRAMDPWVGASAVFGGTIRLIQLRLDGMVTQPLPELADELIVTTWRGVLPGEITTSAREA